MTTTTTPNQPKRGPLSHIIDAIRIDNRSLFLETLCHDPRYPDGSPSHGLHGVGGHGHGHGDAADSAAGNANTSSSSKTTTNKSLSPPLTTSTIQKQQLIFGSHDLRRVILHQVISRATHITENTVGGASSSSGGGGGSSGGAAASKSKKKKNKNKTQVEEEEEILSDLNEELLASSNNNIITSSGSKKCCIVSSNILSPSGDGSIISPYYHNYNSSSSSSKTGSGNSNKKSTNPFVDDDHDDNYHNRVDSTTHNSDKNNGGMIQDDFDTPITTYILRGGGFDLPSLAAAAKHRRRILSSSSSRSSGGTEDDDAKLFRFVFVPRITEMEQGFLKDLGVVDDLENVASIGGGGGGGMGGKSSTSLESLPIDLIPLDDDVLSLEIAGGGSNTVMNGFMGESDVGGGGGGGGGGMAFPPRAATMRHADIEGCESDVADIVARSILKLQLLNRVGSGEYRGDDNGGATGGDGVNDIKSQASLRGAIARVQGLGPLATAVIDRMMTLRLEEERMEAQAEDDDEEDEDEGEEVEEDYYNQDGYDDQDEVNSAAPTSIEVTASTSRDEYFAPGETQKHENNENIEGNATGVPAIQALFVIDRKIDLVTPMLTPLTYEGLIDDVLSIQVGGCVSVKKSVVEPNDDNDNQQQQSHHKQQQQHHNQQHDPTVLLPLNDSDPLYTEVRDRHVETFGSFLQNQAKALKESHSQFTNRETARDLTEIHQFVKQIPVFTRNLRSLTNHIHIAELVKRAAEASSFRQRWQTERSMLESEPCYDMLEDLIASGEPPYRWLRLFCLQSLTSNGIKATRYDSLRREVVQTYGYEFLIVLNDLEKAGFLRKRETFFMDSMATSYSTLRKALNLIQAEVDASSPDDVAYVSSGYAPMTIRWIQAAMKGYSGMEEAMKELPTTAGVGAGSGAGAGGRWIDIEQRSPPESLVEAMRRPKGKSLGTLANNWSESTGRNADEVEKKPVLLVYFVGGVTHMEIAAMRFLSKRPSFPYTIVCCTTEIVNGSTLLRSLSC